MKLVRDKIPEIIKQNGDQCTVLQVSQSDPLYKEVLQSKLLEEVIEFQRAGDIEELADVLEVVYALMRLPEYKNVQSYLKEKRNSHGQFEKGFILMTTTKIQT